MEIIYKKLSENELSMMCIGRFLDSVEKISIFAIGKTNQP